MYEELLKIGKKYVGMAASIFIDAVLVGVNVDKNSITDKDLDAIAKVAVEKMINYGLAKEAYSDPVKRDILSLRKSV